MSNTFTVTRGSIVALLVAATCWGFVADIRAQELDGLGESDGSLLKASVQLGANYTDNFYYSANPGSGVFGALLKPQISYLYGLPRFQFIADGTADLAGFNSPSSEDNYADVQSRLRLVWLSAERHRFGYGAAVKFGHDAFGTERTAGTSLQDRVLDRWRTEAMDATYFYGLPIDTLKVGLRAKANNKRYTTNIATTQFIDYSSVSGGATLFYKLGPKTDFLIDASGKQTVFDKSEQLSFNEMRYLAGVRWQATAKTSGDARIGLVRSSPRNATSSGFKDFSALSWQADVHWMPLTYRKFSFTTGRDSEASYLRSVSFNDVRYSKLTWSESLSSRLVTKVSGGALTTNFVNTSRTDDMYTAAISAEYEISQAVVLLGNIGYEWRDSTIDTIDYKKYTAYLGMRYAR